MSNIVIRRAVVTDAVNIYKLIQKNKALHVQPEAAKLMAFIVNLIAGGYVAVAELSGNILGTIGTSVYQPVYSDEWVMRGEFTAVTPHGLTYGVKEALDAHIEKTCAKNPDATLIRGEDATWERPLVQIGVDPTEIEIIE